LSEQKRVIKQLSSLSPEQFSKESSDPISGHIVDKCNAEHSADIPFQEQTVDLPVDAVEDTAQQTNSQPSVLKERDEEKAISAHETILSHEMISSQEVISEQEVILSQEALKVLPATNALHELELLPMDAAPSLTVLLLDFGMEMGDSQCQLHTLARSLHEQDSVCVIVACPRQSALRILMDNEGIPCYPLASPKGTNLRLLISLAWLIRKHRIRLLHTQDAESVATGWLLKKFFKEKLVLIHSQNGLQDIPIKKYLQADAIVCLSQTIGVTLVALGISEDKIFTIQSSIDPIDAPVKQPHHAGHYVFLIPGSLVPQKGHTTLLQAMVLLDEMDDLPPWEVHCVDAGRLAPELFEEALQLECLPHLMMLGSQDRRTFLAGANAVLVLTHEIAKASLAIKEAWAAKVPLICSNNLSNLELVQDKQTGLVVPDGNPVALASLMMRLMTGVSFPDTLETGWALVQQEYTHANRLDAMLAVYQKLCGLQKPV